MSARCPEGHLSESLDYCDVCGSPMGAAPDEAGGSLGAATPDVGGPAPGPALPEPAETPDAATQTCPHCGAVNVADALFCEACGYDFTTGTPPMGDEPELEPELELTTQDAATPDPATSDPGTSDPADHVAPSAPLSSVDPQPEATEQGQSVTSSDEDSPLQPEEEPEAAEPEPAGPPEPEPEPAGKPASPIHRKARHTPPSRALAEAWVVELWVDPDWYAVQQTEEACPSAGVPDIVLLTRSTALIGRPSGSLGVRPEVDAGADSAVSRRHAQLTSDGQRWWVEDLGSSNGTFVGTVGEPLPTAPVPPGQRVEIDRDDRLYVGAWTRLVLRQATASEQQGTG